jgi:cysteine desulfurase
MSRIFFDNASTTPMATEVIELMASAMASNFGNPSSIHAEGRQARAAIEQARKTVARLLGASIGEIFFTSGGTESSNMVIKNAVRDLGIQRIISTRIEHHCVLHTIEALERDFAIEAAWLDLDSNGHIDAVQLEKLLAQSGKKTLVSLMHANNEIGNITDLQLIGSICRQHGALFHSDTVQTIGYYSFDLSTLPVDFITGSAHKFFGPKGTGFVYIRNEYHLKPFMDGGGQERNMRGGTENTPGILGLAKALELAYENLDFRKAHIINLRDRLRAGIRAAFPQCTYYGDPDSGHYKILNIGFPPSPRSELLLLNLDIEGISISGGSACTSGADAGSHVVDALGGKPGWKAVRFSLSHHNTAAEVDSVLEKLHQCLP